MMFEKTHWKQVKVGELGQIITGKTPKTSIIENYGGTIPFLTPSDNMLTKYVTATKKTLTDKGLMEVKNCLLPKNSVCVSCIGSDLGKVVITTKPTVSNQQINSIIVNQEKFDVSFVYYAMLILGKQLNYMSKTSTAVPIVNKTDFSSYSIFCPDLKKQNEIASILSSFDDKIDLNNKINENLEQQVRMLLTEWLTENKGTSEVSLLYDVAEINPDTYSPKAAWEYVNYLDTSSITDGIISEVQYIKPSTQKLPSRARRIISAYDVVFSTVRPNQRHFGIIIDPLENMLASTGFAVIRSNHPSVSNELLYLCLTESSFVEKMQQLAEQSTSTFPSIKPSDLGCCEIPCSISTDLAEVIKTVFACISINQKENRALAQLRDTLLPQLMSGEISMSDIHP